MLQTIIAFLLIGFIVISIIVLIIVKFTYRGIREMRETLEENYERSQKRKQQKEKNPFGEDYFRSADSPKRPNRPNQPKQPNQEKATARKTTTSSGVTIIDEREKDKKIFDSNDGEYVEFEEV